jgi:glutamate-5-semialdehyde dehydrogenase
MTIQTPAPNAELAETMLQLGRNARAASRALGKLTADDRTRGLKAIAAAIRAAAPDILAANAEDMEAAREKGPRCRHARPAGAGRGARRRHRQRR